MKRQGKPSWTWNVAPPRLMQIRLAIEARRETVREIYVRLDLQRFTCFSTFRRYVTQQRAINRARESGTPPIGQTRVAVAAAGEAPRFRGRWGTRGIARLRKLGPGRTRRARSVRGRMGVTARRRRLAADHRGPIGRCRGSVPAMPGWPVNNQLSPGHGRPFRSRPRSREHRHARWR